MLPVLAATMFLAEPARNLRAFLVNKMLLDMIETGMTYGGRKPNSAPKHYTWQNTLLKDPQEKGGKSPAAMSGSAKAGELPIRPDATQLGTGYYTQTKEASIICHYLHGGSMTGTNADQIDKKKIPRAEVRSDPLPNSTRDASTPEKFQGWVKYLLMQSIKTFDA